MRPILAAAFLAAASAPAAAQPADLAGALPPALLRLERADWSVRARIVDGTTGGKAAETRIEASDGAPFPLEAVESIAYPSGPGYAAGRIERGVRMTFTPTFRKGVLRLSAIVATAWPKGDDEAVGKVPVAWETSSFEAVPRRAGLGTWRYAGSVAVGNGRRYDVTLDFGPAGKTGGGSARP